MKDLIQIAKKINDNGGNLYLVGGAVRDEIIGLNIHDEDYSVTGISFEEFKNLFPCANIRGNDFPVFSMDNKEFAIARRERKIGIGHNDFYIKTDKKITIEEDLERRDITINAIAKEVLTGKIIDPFGGKSDIENHIIRAVSNHFSEDPLRVYRTARFASQLDFKVEENTIKMMKTLKNELLSLSVERVYNEFRKAILTNKPSLFFDVLREAGVLDIHFIEIYNLIGALQPIKYHPEGDSYNHTMIVLDKTSEKTKQFEEERKLEIRFAALVHDIGKGETPKVEYPHHINHEKRGAELVKKIGNRLKLPTRLIKCGKTACLEHMRGGVFDKMKETKKVSFIEKIYNTILGLDGLQIIVDSDNITEEKNKNQFAELGYKIMNYINGKKVMEEYGINPGIQVANKLHEVRVRYLKKYYKNF